MYSNNVLARDSVWEAAASTESNQEDVYDSNDNGKVDNTYETSFNFQQGATLKLHGKSKSVTLTS